MDSHKDTEEVHRESMKKMLNSRLDLKDYVLKNARQGDIQNIIDTIDQYGWTKQWLMNIGDQKGKILDQAIQTRKPKIILELGTFLGYSSLRIISQLPDNVLFITIEANSQSAEIVRSIFEFAGVTNRINIINDYSDNVIPHLSKNFNIDSFDFIFIDHFKDVYLRDFKMLEDTRLIKAGTMIVADNVITPGAPDYLKYVRNNPNYTSTFYEGKIEYREDLDDGVEISIRK
ncbi:unnamed protein product [Rotaria sordida]|uniref:catechol O-methyltransferase n=1 Tax=Rotaria sordida TaxID=392033 RepID=A0A815MA08_9BILA|nr:unnamed protein product [Rotaria sordida]CAF1451915.1 unnamed protein product [Rotaria sordida]CAF4042530.1 unnamed protein product [Rotaria sordida]CAF4099958.1 unnamed protein product [Rotaria sordida]